MKSVLKNDKVCNARKQIYNREKRKACILFEMTYQKVTFDGFLTIGSTKIVQNIIAKKFKMPFRRQKV